MRTSLFVTGGCWCGRCYQLRFPALYALAQAMHCIYVATLFAPLAPHLTGNYYRWRS